MSGLDAAFRGRFGESSLRRFRCPGRIEVAGNHTDHHRGRVLAAAVSLAATAVAAKTSERRVTVFSEGYAQPIVVELDRLAPDPAERGGPQALVRGIVARFRELGYETGGFNACVSSSVPVGSGLSSSASFEVLVASMVSALYNDAGAGILEIARICRHAENHYFGKPCGLMDQIACAAGGLVGIDFADPGAPKLERLSVDFERLGCQAVVVSTGSDHAGLTDEYAAIPLELGKVAAFFGRQSCSEIDEAELRARLPELRSAAGDRAILRALHFFGENARVGRIVGALKDGDLPGFLSGIAASGRSSFELLQNCLDPRSPGRQGIALALALTGEFLRDREGACRVHGGGFAGTILAFLRREDVPRYIGLMEPVFGSGCVKVMETSARGCGEATEDFG